MDNLANLERQRIIILLRAEQEIVKDDLAEMLIERLINKINALPLESNQRQSSETSLHLSEKELTALSCMVISSTTPTESIDELNLIKARAAALINQHH